MAFLFHRMGNSEYPNKLKQHKITVDILKRIGVYRNYYKGHMDKSKGDGAGGGERWVQLGWGGGMGRKCRQL